MAEFKPISPMDFQAKRRVSASPRAIAAWFDAPRRRIVIELDSGIEFSFLADRAHGLDHADPATLSGLSIEGAGNALHFPGLDADFSIPQLLEGFLGPLKWTSKLIRAEASRRNGAKGGRPRRPAVAA